MSRPATAARGCKQGWGTPPQEGYTILSGFGTGKDSQWEDERHNAELGLASFEALFVLFTTLGCFAFCSGGVFNTSNPGLHSPRHTIFLASNAQMNSSLQNSPSAELALFWRSSNTCKSIRLNYLMTSFVLGILFDGMVGNLYPGHVYLPYRTGFIH